MTQDERDKKVAEEIKAGRCPFGEWRPGDPGVVGICHLGVPGCGCADEMLLNPYLQDLFNTSAEEEQNG